MGLILANIFDNNTFVIIFLIVISVLALIIVSIFRKLSKSNDESVAIATEITNISNTAKTNLNEQEIAAAISSAIAVYLENESRVSGKPRAGFVVKAIKKL